jgi:hypothetical protein
LLGGENSPADFVSEMNGSLEIRVESNHAIKRWLRFLAVLHKVEREADDPVTLHFQLPDDKLAGHSVAPSSLPVEVDPRRIAAECVPFGVGVLADC